MFEINDVKNTDDTSNENFSNIGVIHIPDDYVYGCETETTDKFRLLHKKDGTYVLQRKKVSRIYRARNTDIFEYWEDFPTVEEGEENE